MNRAHETHMGAQTSNLGNYLCSIVVIPNSDDSARQIMRLRQFGQINLGTENLVTKGRFSNNSKLIYQTDDSVQALLFHYVGYYFRMTS